MQTPQFPDSRSFDPLPGESQEDRERRLYSLDRTVQAAERVSEKFRELASVLQEWDTSAAEASKAFQGLQEASKDLVDLEIVIPKDYRTPEQQATLDAAPKGPSFHLSAGYRCDVVRLVTEHGAWEGVPHEQFQVPISLEHVAIVDRGPLPWYKRLWSWLTIPFQAVKASHEHEEQVQTYKSAGIWGEPK